MGKVEGIFCLFVCLNKSFDFSGEISEVLTYKWDIYYPLYFILEYLHTKIEFSVSQCTSTYTKGKRRLETGCIKNLVVSFI